MSFQIIEEYKGTARWSRREGRWTVPRSEGNIIMEHDKQFLTFRKPWSPSTEYKYNLDDGEFIRIKHFKTKEDTETRVRRENAASWFSKCDLATESSRFAKLYYYAKCIYYRRDYSNPTWFIELFADPRVKIMDQWLSAGFNFLEIERMATDGHVYFGYRQDSEVLHSPKEYSKNLFQWLKAKVKNSGHISITELNKSFEHWNDNQYDVFKKIDQKIKDEPQYEPVFNCPLNEYRDWSTDILHSTTHAAQELRNNIITTMQEFNLDMDRFLEYCLYLSHSESVHLGKLMADYPDYLRRELHLQGGKMRKMNKYPECWLTTTHKQQIEFQNLQRLERLEKGDDTEEFDNSIQANKYLEWKKGNYLIRMPNNAEDIRDEAAQMEHCVATYIPDIEKGRRIIMFMRDIEHPERSLVTVEVINGAITQAYAKNDKHPTMACKLWLMNWAQEKELRITAVTLG